MSLLPARVDVSPDPAEPEVLDLATADEALDALGSGTARDILAALYEEPMPPPEIREIVGTSLQNVHYHLDHLEAAGLIEPAGTGYSEKGTEMTVYGPAREAIVLFAGRAHERARLRDLLARVVGLLAILAIATVAFARLVGELTRSSGAGASVAVADTETARAPAGGGGGGLLTDVGAVLAEPAVAFFLGGLLLAVVAGAWWLYRR